MKRFVVLALLVTSCVSVEPVQPGDASLVVRVDDLASYGLTLPSDYQQHESLQRAGNWQEFISPHLRALEAFEAASPGR
jgi:hypothetical protein